MRLALFQPDIAQNTGAIIRLAACFETPLDIIEPCGFVLDDRKLARAALDYGPSAEITRHVSWESYRAAPHEGRLVLLTTRGAASLSDFAFHPGDRLMLGRESAGVPDPVHKAADARVVIPLAPGCRSHVAQAAAIALYEALRQTSMARQSMSAVS